MVNVDNILTVDQLTGSSSMMTFLYSIYVPWRYQFQRRYRYDLAHRGQNIVFYAHDSPLPAQDLLRDAVRIPFQ